MKKSLFSVVMLFIAWAVSAAAISTPRAIVRLEAAVCNNVFGLHSRYTMKYAVNRLASMEIEREGEDYEGRTGVGATGKISDFWYDANGNLGKDMSRGILSTEYNRLNLPTDVYFINGHRQTIQYDGFGQKRSVSYSQTSDPILGSMMGVPEDSAYTLQGRRDYIGPHVFVGDSLEYSAFPGGYFTPEGVFYYITDWQGNNIAVFSDKGELVQQTTYYPYGEPTIEPTGQRYLFGGKEREHAGGYNSYDFVARSLGPSANWDSADRKATENYPISPFSYCNGDPINHIDPTGMKSAVIRIDGEIGHIALLVQHADDGLYHYYSFNGDKMHASSTSSGHSINNHGEVGFTSVEEFMNSSFNQEGSEARVTNHEIAGFKYTEALELNTTAEQDASIISAFEQSSKFPYDLIKHNCAHVVSDAIIPNLQNDPYQNSYDKRMNIPEVRPSFKPEGESYITDLLLFLYDSILTPNSLFNEIKRHTENK